MTDTQVLKKDGFTAYEAKTFIEGWKAKGGIDSPAFVAMRESRKQWWADLLAKGYTRAQIWKVIRDYYKRPKRNPFDWLRKEYQPAKRITQAQYRDAAKRRKKAASITKPMYRLSKTKPRGKVTATVKGKPIEF